MENRNRTTIADLIYSKLLEEEQVVRKQFNNPKDRIGYFYIDNLLPENIAKFIYESFSKPEQTTLKRSLRKHNYIAAQMNKYDPVLEEIIYAFQDDRIVKLISQGCEIENPLPGNNLYAGGISMATHQGSWHSVSPVKIDRTSCCVSN
jgi:Rps23 Pro-64 3,4-dihydroxylase Tpa1-like proline 4-hydroxylase